MVSRLARTVLLTIFLLAWPGGLGWANKADEKESVRIFVDPETADVLDVLSRPLLEAAGMPPDQVRFHVMLDNTLNAFALPNNHIVFHSYLVLAVHNPQELAAVMAHEIAHLAAGHHVQMQDSARHISIRSLVISALGMAAGLATKNSQLGQASMMGGMASGTAAMLEMVREKEAQSDRLAIHYLAKSGYNPEGLIAFMEHIAKEQRLNPVPPPYLLTHPLGGQRLDEAKDMATRIVPEFTRQDRGMDRRLQRIQAKLKASSGTDPHETAVKFRAALKKKPTDFSIRYGLAMAERYGGNVEESTLLLTALIKEAGGRDPFLLRERAMGRLEKGQLKEARKDIEAALAEKPDDPDFQYRQAFLMKEMGELANASRVLRRLTQEHEEYPEALYLFGTVEGELGREGSSHLALARYNRLNGEREAAMWHYRNAIKTTTPGLVEKSQAEGELETMMEEEEKPFFSSRRKRR